jgi:hypothetical protein
MDREECNVKSRCRYAGSGVCFDCTRWYADGRENIGGDCYESIYRTITYRRADGEEIMRVQAVGPDNARKALREVFREYQVRVQEEVVSDSGSDYHWLHWIEPSSVLKDAKGYWTH